MTFLLTVLVAAPCFFTASAEVMPQADFNLQAMAGKWYLIGFATNAEWFVHRKSSMKMGTAMFSPIADGVVNMSYASLNSDGSCWRMNSLGMKTGTAGKFTYTSERWGNENDMRMVEVKYDKYALTHTTKIKDGEAPIVIIKLYGRGVDLSPDLLEKFRQFSLREGILPDNIALLPKNGECPSA